MIDDNYNSRATDVIINKKASGWVWGNIVFGGLIGLAVDAATGGMYKLEPNEVSRQLRENSANVRSEDMLHIAVVMEPDPDWEKIGQLRPTR